MALINGTNGNDDLRGTSVADTINGFGGDDVIRGFAGNDILDGGPGGDVMRGMLGDDIYYLDDSRDVAYEEAGEGIDTVYASVTYGLRSNIEHLTLTGSAAITATVTRFRIECSATRQPTFSTGASGRT